MSYSAQKAAAAATPATGGKPTTAGKVAFRTRTHEDAKSASKWQAGEVYVGYLAGTKQLKTQHKENAKIFEFRDATEDGEQTGKTTFLWDSGGLDLAGIGQGQLIRITCAGEKQSPKSKRKYVHFDIETSDMYLPSSPQ